MKVLDITTKAAKYEVHMLNPGESFAGFGGSRHALLVKKTASCVIRERSSMGLRDTEYGITSRHLWQWIETLCALGHKEGVVVKYAELENTEVQS